MRTTGIEYQSQGRTVFCGRCVGHRPWNPVDASDADPVSNGSHLTIPIASTMDSRRAALLGVAGVAMRGVRRGRFPAGRPRLP